MQVKIGSVTENDLQRIKDAAIYRFKQSHNNTIASDLWPVQCYIESFVDFLAQKDVDLVLEMPNRKAYQSIDED